VTRRLGAAVAGLLLVGTMVLAVATGLLGSWGSAAPGSPSPAGTLVGSATPSPTPLPVIPTPEPTADPTPTPVPTPTPEPTPVLVRAPLTGELVTEEAARRRVIAVMVDDHGNARPQSGFNDASIVWHAPAEGGIPRYMLLFQERIPGSVGPIRSARPYYIGWAAEWKSMYVHSGGSPQALRILRSADGRGGLVYDADEFRWGGRYLWRAKDRRAPHNVYTDGKHLRQLAIKVGAEDGDLAGAWRFAPDPAFHLRPTGGRIEVPYSYNRVVYQYDRESNRYLRSVTGASKQVDRADGKRVAPKNVVILSVRFRLLGDAKLRQEAEFIGEGPAWIASNGITIKGTWKKTSMKAPTLLFDASGKPVTLTIGQTFVQVVPRGTKLVIKDGTPAAPVKPPPPGPDVR
jgi:hypothetical protein